MAIRIPSTNIQTERTTLRSRSCSIQKISIHLPKSQINAQDKSSESPLSVATSSRGGSRTALHSGCTLISVSDSNNGMSGDLEMAAMLVLTEAITEEILQTDAARSTAAATGGTKLLHSYSSRQLEDRSSF